MKSGLVLIFAVLLVFSLFSGAFISTVQAATISTHLQITSITPKVAALGEKVTIIGTIYPEPPSGYAYHGIMFNVVDINGNYRNIGSNKTLTGNGTFCFSWTPDIRGNYLVNITYPGETLDTGNVYVGSQGSDSFFVDSSLATPTPTPRPATTPEPTPVPSSTSTGGIYTSINVNCQSSTAYSNFKVDIQGTLTANDAGLSGSPIQLSFSVDGGSSWTQLTFLSSDSTGAFQAVWTPLVTGNYFLKATYNGTSELSAASTIVHFAVLPVEDTSVFSVASNSTVTGLTFNYTSQELSFKVSGETGTTGYVKVYIAKSLMNDTSNLKAYFDHELLQPGTQSMGDSWLVSFTYHHSEHTISLALNSDASNIRMGTQNLSYTIAGVVSAFFAVAAVITLLKSKAKHKNV